jgi:pyruvate dehydrogenase E2 component (dihydrolipoamide acetyltransferase)
MSEIVMPRLSDTMEEGTILRWLVADGEHVARGQELVEIETDKANMTYESDQEGTLKTIAAEGDTLAVGATIAQVGEAATPVEPAQTPVEPAQTPVEPAQQEKRVKASPLARRIAQESNIDLHEVTGTGPGGRIVKADLQGADETEPAAQVTTAKGETTIVELSRTQQTIARRMAEAKATIPEFTLQMEIDMEACVELRGELKKLAKDGPPTQPAPTYNDMVVKACALALREHPRANGGYRDGRAQMHSRVNVGVAVAGVADGPAGATLIVPTVFDADQKSLGEIARETRALAERVRDGSITPPELGGGTFTVSNLGMFGVSAFTAIINPPQAAILSVGALGPRAVVRNGEVVARNTVAVTLACDHRILYGADAATFLARIRELLEAPASLTL